MEDFNNIAFAICYAALVELSKPLDKKVLIQSSNTIHFVFRDYHGKSIADDVTRFCKLLKK